MSLPRIPRASKLLVQPLTPSRALRTTSPSKMRVSYAPSEPQNEADKPIYERIAARRAPRPLIPLDLALLHNTAVADGWNSFIGALRTKTTVPEALKELAISRVAVLNSAVHEWNSHGPLALKGGITTQGLETAFTAEVVKKGDKLRDGDEGGLTKDQWIIIAYTDQMTRGVEVDAGVTEALKGFLSETQVVELTAVIAGYNCVSRFLVALDVGESNDKAMKKPQDM